VAQKENKMKLRVIFCFLALFLFVNTISVVSAEKSSFEVGSVLIKVAVHRGEIVDKKITVTANEAGQFTLTSGAQGVLLEESEFILAAGDSKTINVKFDSSKLSEGVYVGEINIRSLKEVYSVPVIFEVESVDVIVDGNLDVSPQYSEIFPGEKLVVQLNLFDLTWDDYLPTSSKNVNVDYKVYSLDGQVISSDSEGMAVEKSEQTTKTVTFDESTKLGVYVFAVTMKSGSSVGATSYLFNVRGKKATDYFGSITRGDLVLIIAMVVILLFFSGLIFLFIYILRDRNKLITELRRHHNAVFEKQRRILNSQASEAKEKGIINFAQIKQGIRDLLDNLKKKNSERLAEMKKLGQLGDFQQMERKLQEWKKEGEGDRWEIRMFQNKEGGKAHFVRRSSKNAS